MYCSLRTKKKLLKNVNVLDSGHTNNTTTLCGGGRGKGCGHTRRTTINTRHAQISYTRVATNERKKHRGVGGDKTLGYIYSTNNGLWIRKKLCWYSLGIIASPIIMSRVTHRHMNERFLFVAPVHSKIMSRRYIWTRKHTSPLLTECARTPTNCYFVVSLNITGQIRLLGQHWSR